MKPIIHSHCHHLKSHAKEITKETQFNPHNEFKRVIKQRMRLMQTEMMIIADGNVSNSDIWDAIGEKVIGAGMGTIGCVLAVLGVIGIISPFTLAIIGIPLTIISVVVAIGYNIYCDQKKAVLFKRARKLFDDDNTDEIINKIADNIAVLYRYQISTCSHDDIKKFSNTCFEGISHALIHNKKLTLSDMLCPQILKQVLEDTMITKTKIHNPTIHLLTPSYREIKAKQLAKHPALSSATYCHHSKKKLKIPANDLKFFKPYKPSHTNINILSLIKSKLISFFKPIEKSTPVSQNHKTKEAYTTHLLR